MTNTFDFSRFRKVAHMDAIMYGRQYLSMVGIVIGIVFMVITLRSISIDYDRGWYTEISSGMLSFETGLYWFGLGCSACFIGAYTMHPLASKTSRINYMMVPGAQSEKFLWRLILCVPLYFMLYTIGFELIETLRYVILKICYPESPAVNFLGIALFRDYYGSPSACEILFGILALQSVFVLGSSIWPRRGGIYTGLFLALMTFALIMWVGLCTVLFLSPEYSYHPAFDDMETTVDHLWYALLMVVFMTINYVTAYYRYKEIELVQRW